MRIYDRSVLASPFYEDRHRELAERVEGWADGMAGRVEAWGPLDPSSMGRDFARTLGDEGWFAHAAGPAGPDFRAIALIREGFAFFHDLCDFAFAIQALAAAPLVHHGSSEQRDRLLPDLLSGRAIGSFAISEREAGSHVAGIALRAERCGDAYRLDGEKTWIANGDIADIHTVLARTGEGPGALGLSLLMVPADTPGLSVSPRIEATAPRSFASLSFDDCRVPAANLIGKPGMGFPIAMEVLDRYRLTVGAAAVGFARRARAAALGWSRSRRVADGLLFDMQLTKAKIADAETGLTAASLLVAQAAWELDRGSRGYGKHSSMAKLFATEMAQRVVDDAVQICGAAGLVRDSVPERLYRQIRSLRIYEGTSEIQRMIIAGYLRNAPV